MNRNELESFIKETYNADANYPWPKYPNYEVFRHSSNQKWFALIMDVPKSKLGLQGTETLAVVNFKCTPLLIGSLREESGFFPAYHMNKDNWITVALDGSVSGDKIKMLLDMSYQATAPKYAGKSVDKSQVEFLHSKGKTTLEKNRMHLEASKYEQK